MRNAIKQAPALKPRSSIPSVYDFARISLHERSGANITVAGRVGGVDFSTTAALQGSPASTVWTANAGWMTPEGDNWTAISNITQVADLLTLANRPAGGLLIMAAVRQESNPADSTEHAILSVNGASGTAGAFTLMVDNFATAHVKLVHRPVGSSSDTTTTLNATTTAATIPVSCYINCATTGASIIGVTANASAHTTFNPGALTQLATISAVQKGTFLARDAAAPLKVMNNGTAQWKIHDFYLVGFDTDPIASGKLAAIISEFGSNSYDYLRSLTT